MTDLEYLQRISMADRFFVRYEGLSAARVKNIFSSKQHIFPFVSYSDDTQLSIRVYKSIANAQTKQDIDTDLALSNFKRELKYWILSLPPHLGKATAVSCIKNILGIKKSGYPSAGNGALMRIGVIARFFEASDLKISHKAELIQKLCIENTIATHSNYEACIVNLWHTILCIALKKTHLYHTPATLIATVHNMFNLLNDWVKNCEVLFVNHKIAKSKKSISNIVGYTQTIDALQHNSSLQEFVRDNPQFYAAGQVSGYCIDTSVLATLKFFQSCVRYSENQRIDFLDECMNLTALGGDTDTVAVVYAQLFFNAYPMYTCLCDKASRSMASYQDYYGELSLEYLKNGRVLGNLFHSLKLVPKNVWLLLKMIAIRLNDIVRY